MSSTLSAVVFDMDGTLVDSMPYHNRAWLEFLHRKGFNVTYQEVFDRIHGTLFDIMPRFFGADISHEESLALGLEKEAIFMELYAPHVAALPGLEAWLETLKAAGMKIALATAADDGNTTFTLNAIQLTHYFDAIVTSNEVPEGKPSPAVFLRAAEKLVVSPTACFAFEDTFSGVAAARAAGMQVAAITTMHPQDAWDTHGVVAAIPDYTQVTLPWLRSFLHK